VRHLGLRYRVEGALALEGRQRRLTWAVIPPDRAEPIGRAEVTFQVPDGVAILMPSGIGESGWEVSVAPGQLRASRSGVPAGEGATLLSLVSGDTFPVREPDWQFNRARTAELAPAFVAGGLFILVVGVGIVVMLWWHDRGVPDRRGLFDRENRTQLRISGIVVLVAGVVGVPLTDWLLGRFGPWPQALPISLVVSGLLFLLTAAPPRPTPQGPKPR
jgi:hypothetical protein